MNCRWVLKKIALSARYERDPTGEAAANVRIENNTVRNLIFIICLAIDKIMDVVRETVRIGRTRLLTRAFIFSPFAQLDDLPRNLLQTNTKLFIHHFSQLPTVQNLAGIRHGSPYV